MLDRPMGSASLEGLVAFSGFWWPALLPCRQARDNKGRRHTVRSHLACTNIASASSFIRPLLQNRLLSKLSSALFVPLEQYLQSCCRRSADECLT